ncbi:MAG: C69 family dipeptidase [Candidatus Marinimicrobia bacterium]|nr:C69 family dipeptidase [Candidatus Neomarinimicrobiota bacterium]
MSSIIVIPPAVSPDGAAYLAKNSNRHPNECQPVVAIAGVEDDASSLISCTYLTIAQQPRRYAVVLSTPWWCWGGEMGANDQGVAIACEPILTRDTEFTEGLIGSDLVRLGLERGSSAEDAMNVIISLFQKHGQGGPAGVPWFPRGNDNTFVVVDASEAWLLETAGRHWAAKRIKRSYVTVPVITIGVGFDRHSYAAEPYAERKGWHRGIEEFDFRKSFERRRGARSRNCIRRAENMASQLSEIDNTMPLLALMKLLRYRRNSTAHSISHNDFTRAASSKSHQEQTTGAMAVRISPNRQDHFFTAASATDLAVFKPVHFGQPLENDLADKDLGHYSGDSLWWRQEEFHRNILRASEISPQYIEERDTLENKTVLELLAHKGSDLTDLRWRLQQELVAWEKGWREQINVKPRIIEPSRFKRYWKRLSAQAGVPQ